MQRLMSVLLLVVAACGGSDGGSSPNGFPDAPTGGAQDAFPSSDAAAFSGLTIQWEDSPALPGPQSASVTVTSARFHIKKLEVIGDGGSLPATTHDDFDIVWNQTMQPFDITFFSAPPAIYSKIRLAIDKGSSGAPSVEILGSVVINSTTESFKITSQDKADLEVTGYAVTLGIGESEFMPIIVGLDSLLADVNWSALPTTNNVRILDDANNTARDALFDHLEFAFTGPNE